MYRLITSIPGIAFAAMCVLSAFCSCTNSRQGGASLDVLVTQMQDPDAAVREEAVNQTVACGAAAVGPLADLMAGDDADVAAHAARALQGIVDNAVKEGKYAWKRRQVVDALMRLLKEDRPKPVHRRALEGLAQLGDESSVSAIAPFLVDADLHESARLAMQNIPGSAAGQALIDALERAPADVTLPLIESIGRRQDRRAIPALTARFQLGTPAEADAAMTALAEIGEPVESVFSLRALQRMPTSDVDRRALALIRYAELHAQRGQAKESVELLNAILSRPPSDATRSAAIRMLGQVGDGAVAASLVPYLVDSSSEIAEAAKDALVALKDPPPPSGFDQWSKKREEPQFPTTVNARLLRMYGFAEPVKKAALLRIIAARQMPEARQLLLEATTHSEPGVRRAAFEVLTETFDGQDPTLQAVFLRAARTDAEVRPEAIGGCVRYAEFLQTVDPEAASKLYRELLDLAPDLATQTLVGEKMTQLPRSTAPPTIPAETEPVPSTGPE